jgi:bleomycin hydrolase
MINDRSKIIDFIIDLFYNRKIISKNMKTLVRVIFIALVFLYSGTLILTAQDLSGYKFKNIKEIKNTPVEDQQATGTCWSFATTSFIESELIRMGKDALDLSEMYFVRYAYLDKADNYFRLHGSANFGQGGQAHDVLNVVEKYGFVPEDIYKGLNYGSDIHDHSELASVLKGFLDGLIKNRKPSQVWDEAYTAILDTYLGAEVKLFDYKGKPYTPSEFAKNMNFNPENYIELTSYSHAPFYSEFVLEIPDNWSFDRYYNVPVDDLVRIVDNALDKGYTVCWDGDVSEKGFTHTNGVAVVLEEGKSGDVEAVSPVPVKEKFITQELRQECFNNYSTTDDHLMHLIGTAEDQDGKRFYLTKNSWGEKSNTLGGKLYMSVPYIRLHTIAILLHKDAIPVDIKLKLGLE